MLTAKTGISPEGTPKSRMVILFVKLFLEPALKDSHEEITMKGKREGTTVLSHRLSPLSAAAVILSLYRTILAVRKSVNKILNNFFIKNPPAVYK